MTYKAEPDVVFTLPIIEGQDSRDVVTFLIGIARQFEASMRPSLMDHSGYDFKCPAKYFSGFRAEILAFEQAQGQAIFHPVHVTETTKPAAGAYVPSPV